VRSEVFSLLDEVKGALIGFGAAKLKTPCRARSGLGEHLRSTGVRPGWRSRSARLEQFSVIMWTPEASRRA